MHSSNCPWLVGIQQHVHSLLHYTFSKPEAAFNFIKKRVKTTWLPALLSVGVCVFSPLYIPIFFCWLTAPGFSFNRLEELSSTQRWGGGSPSCRAGPQRCGGKAEIQLSAPEARAPGSCPDAGQSWPGPSHPGPGSLLPPRPLPASTAPSLCVAVVSKCECREQAVVFLSLSTRLWNGEECLPRGHGPPPSRPPTWGNTRQPAASTHTPRVTGAEHYRASGQTLAFPNL